jgi:hypothetical protein
MTHSQSYTDELFPSLRLAQETNERLKVVAAAEMMMAKRLRSYVFLLLAGIMCGILGMVFVDQITTQIPNSIDVDLLDLAWLLSHRIIWGVCGLILVVISIYIRQLVSLRRVIRSLSIPLGQRIFLQRYFNWLLAYHVLGRTLGRGAASLTIRLGIFRAADVPRYE